jgi:hypothetical protein
VLVIGILNMVFGGLGSLCFLCAMGSQLVIRFVPVPGPGGKNLYQPMVEVLDRELPNLFAIQIVSMVLAMLLAFMVLIGGFGLLRMGSWGRVLTVFALVSLMTLNTATTVWSIIFVNPVMVRAQKLMNDEMVKNMPPNAQAQMNQMQGLTEGLSKNLSAVTPIAMMAAILIYGLVIIVMLYRPSVSAAFAGTAPPTAEPQDNYDPRHGKGV